MRKRASPSPLPSVRPEPIEGPPLCTSSARNADKGNGSWWGVGLTRPSDLCRWPAIMSLILPARLTDGSYWTRPGYKDGLSASMNFFAVSRWMPTSLATPRIDSPLRFAFCTAFHLTV